MLSTETIVALSNEHARIAACQGLAPYVPWDRAEVDGWECFPFPNLGSYQPEDWQLLDYVLADATGKDTRGPALSINGLKRWCAEKIAEHPGRSIGFAIIEVGEFQVVVGAFLRQ